MTQADRVKASGARERLQRIGRELSLLGCAALAYSLVRGLTDDRIDVAFANAERVIAAERASGLFLEPAIQDVALSSGLLTNFANAVYIAYWPVIIGTLAWLLIRQPVAYRHYRNAFLASGVFALALFALVPLAPPRFVPQHGFADTIAMRSDGYRDFNASALVNEYAAMPSLHFGWVLLCAIAVFSLSRRRGVRMAAVAAPVLMLWAIVATGNHYLVDAFAGGAVVLAGLGVAQLLRQRSSSFDHVHHPQRHHTMQADLL